MSDKKSHDYFFSEDYNKDYQIKRKMKEFEKNKKIKDSKNREEFSPIKKLNRKVSIFLDSKKIDLSEDEKKKKIGIIITTLILITLITTSYYFLIYEPAQKELNIAKNNKLNELNSLYTGPLAYSSDVIELKNKIKNSKDTFEVELIDILGPATKSWQIYQKNSINSNKDPFNRTMLTYKTNNTKNIIMNITDAQKFVKENDANVLSNIKFEKPNTVAVPILISRLQASGGLLTIGSIVDIYTISENNNTNYTLNSNKKELDISGCTVLAIIRCEESGEIESEYIKSHNIIQGNITNPNENSEIFKTNVEEMLKGAVVGGYDESNTVNLLDGYGLKLSNYEREINLGDLDSQYILLVEIPKDKVNYILKNMNQIILTIPTQNAPDWMVEEISNVYK